MIHSRCLLAVVIALCQAATTCCLYAQTSEINTVRIELFIRNDSDASNRAEQSVKQWSSGKPGLEVVVHDVLADRKQLSRLWQLARSIGRDKPVVPAIHCFNRVHFGYPGDVQTAALIAIP